MESLSLDKSLLLIESWQIEIIVTTFAYCFIPLLATKTVC